MIIKNNTATATNTTASVSKKKRWIIGWMLKKHHGSKASPSLPSPAKQPQHQKQLQSPPPPTTIAERIFLLQKAQLAHNPNRIPDLGIRLVLPEMVTSPVLRKREAAVLAKKISSTSFTSTTGNRRRFLGGWFLLGKATTNNGGSRLPQQ